MAWLIVPLVLVVLLYLAGFRKGALALLVVAMGAGVFLYHYNQSLMEDAQSRIGASEVVLDNVTITPTFRSSYNLSGRVRNKSETYRLDGISFRVTLRDCAGKDETNCTPIGEATTYVPLDLPPQEARDFIGALYFGSEPIKVKGTFAWNYEIVSITGKRP